MPLLDLAWVLLMGALFVAWIYLVIRILLDVIYSRDLGSLAKVAWMVFVLVIPWLGVLAYFITRGDSMAQHKAPSSQPGAMSQGGFSTGESLESWRTDVGLMYGGRV